MSYPNPAPILGHAIARAIAPRKTIRVSEWAAANRVLTAAESAEPGPWRNDRNPMLVEPMDCMSARSPVHEVVAMWPIQFAKTMFGSNVVGYNITEDPGPIMVCLPGEVPMMKWVSQKLNPMLENSPAIQRAMASTKSRDAANTRTYKEFAGDGQLYIEHAGSPSRLKLSSIRTLIVDELDEFAANLTSQDDPVEMLDGRTSAFPSTYKRLYISTPTIAGVSRIEAKWKESDQRRYHVPCPECGHFQHLEWKGLQYTSDLSQCWYMCAECSAVIEEYHKPQMIAAGRWVPENPGSPIRGYHANCLYYPLGLGPRWLEMAQRWRRAQGDPAKLKTFINDRLAEVWGDAKTKKLREDGLTDQVEIYRLRTAPHGVLAITAGVDTQDDRLAVQILGWGRGMVCWVLDYVELAGDPAEPAVWAQLVDLLNRPIEHACGGLLTVEATAIDAGGHRTDHVYNFVRQKRIRRPMAIFGAKPAAAPVLSKPRLADVNYKGQLDKRGVRIYQVGTVRIKDVLFQRLGADADKAAEDRMVHLSEDLDDFYLDGLISEVYDPKKNRYVPARGGGRNEPLDTWGYAYAAAHRQDVRLHRHTKADWDARETRLLASAKVGALDSRETSVPAANDDEPAAVPSDSRGTPEPIAPPTPPPLAMRSAIDRIVCKYERDPRAAPTAIELAEWRAAAGGTPEEEAVLQALLAQVAEGGKPITALLDRLLVQRARDLLFVEPTVRRPVRRFKRGVRNAGIR
ncbi:MAG TPA: phage terminase large subunit family protein [Luteimonas sp.]|nr:phage terminase large subunit family protein [Luteimonas sp.]